MEFGPVELRDIALSLARCVPYRPRPSARATGISGTASIGDAARRRGATLAPRQKTNMQRKRLQMGK
jgi:hypothetical protein